MNISTSASAAAINDTPFRQDGRKRYAIWLSISGIAFATIWTTRIRRNKLATLFASTLLTAVLVLSACGGSGGTSGVGGGGGGGGNPPVTYAISVAATSANLVRVTSVTVTVQ
jgi:hypothetical protein